MILPQRRMTPLIKETSDISSISDESYKDHLVDNTKRCHHLEIKGKIQMGKMLKTIKVENIEQAKQW
jgi:hypothetical protein